MAEGKDRKPGRAASSRDPSGADTLELPVQFLLALAENPAASAVFDALAPSHQREYIDWVDEARKAETKARRTAKAIEMLLTGDGRKR